MSRTLTVAILFVSWFCIVSVTEAALGTSCNGTADSSNCEATESCTNSSCVCSDEYFDVDGNCVSSVISAVTLNANATSIVYGSSVILTATITSAVPVDTVQWQKEEMNFDITQEKYTQSDVVSNVVTLTITNLVTNDSGSYRVQVNNSAGIISGWSTPVTLSVTGERPTVDVGTISEMGNTVTIHCNAIVSQGSPALTDIYWLVNNVNLSLTDNNKYSGGNLNTPSLTINNIASSDIGEYRCVATNLVGSTTSSQFISLAAPSVGTILQQPAGAVNHNSSVTFTGSYTSLLNATVIKWQKLNGSNYIDIDITTDKYTGSSVTEPSPKLVINSVQFIDETSYGLVVSNGIGSTASKFTSLNVVGGALTVTTGANVTGRNGGSITIDCTVTGPEVNNIQWKRHINNNQEDISIDGQKYSGGSVDVKALTIHKLIDNDAVYQYQCTASNPGGVFISANKATLTVKYGQFNEDCTNIVTCDIYKFLSCSDSKCLCMNTYYHKEEVCYLKTGIASTVIFQNSTTNKFSIFWNNPSIDYELVSGYEVKWRVEGSMEDSSEILSKTVNQYTASRNLRPGQLYIVNVISHVALTDPADNIVVTQGDRKVRLVPLPPGPILASSNFAHDNLVIKWTAPANNTVVTKYRVSIDGATQQTSSHNPQIQFTAKNLTPGMNYTVKIVTVSGTIDNVKESSELIETIRITPTKPGPPTDVSCPESPLDVSLEISWKAPTNPNGRIDQYQINIKEGPRTILTASDETTEKIEGLYPEQTYTFTVQTINDAAEFIRVSDPSSPVACNTKAGVSSPPTKLVLDGIQSRGFHVEFDAPENVSGVLAGYKILVLQDQNCIQQIQVVAGHCAMCMTTSSCPAPITYSVTNISLPVSYNVTGLNPYTQYLVKVAAVNGVGEGHIVNGTATTEEEIPKKPSGITSDDIHPKQITLSWSLQGPSPGNTTFTIDVYEATDDTGGTFNQNNSIKINGFDNKLVQVTGLEEYWPYRFKVNAATKKGNMTSDFSSIFRTLQAAPGKVVGLTVQRKGEDYQTANVSWRLPDLRQHNGVLIDYLFRTNKTGTMETERIPVSLSQPKVERNLSVVPETIYIIEVLLENNMSMYSEISRQSYKAPTGPPPVSNITPVKTKPGEHKPTLNTITIDINTEYFNNKVNGKQVLFGIAVCAVLKCDDMALITYPQDWETLRNWYSAKKLGFPMYRVTNDTFMDNIKAADTSSRSKRSNNEASGFEFTIGEDQSCFSYGESFFCNGPLDPGSQYKVILFACTSGGCTWSQTSESFVTKEKIVAEPFPLALVIGVCLAVVVVFIVVGVVIVIVRRRNSLGKANRYTEKVPNTTSLDEPVPKNIPRKRPIKLKELSDKVTEKHKDSNLHFAREYEDLKALSPKHPAETSELDNNKLKNRYVNILPFDHSRVKLMLTEDDDPSTDFINANYLPGYKSQREYIATQGPIPGTIDDFWRMIWEQNVSIIVMLTLCKEEGRVKCEMYWPENIHEPKQYGDLVVETVSNSTVNFYEFRIFKIKLGDTTRSVKHFHFLQWKDFSANVQNDVMIDFIKNVRNHIRPPDMNGPVVVHCSAGVGRTGTYCALDHLFQFVDEHDLDESIDIFDLVMNLRERRMFMVQTEQQYVFIHDCVRDYVERKKKELQGNLLYENVNRGFVADDEPVEESLYQNYSNQRTDL